MSCFQPLSADGALGSFIPFITIRAQWVKALNVNSPKTSNNLKASQCLIQKISEGKYWKGESTCICPQQDARGCVQEQQILSVKQESQFSISILIKKRHHFQTPAPFYRYWVWVNICRSVIENDDKHVQELHVDLPSTLHQDVKLDQIQAGTHQNGIHVDQVAVTFQYIHHCPAQIWHPANDNWNPEWILVWVSKGKSNDQNNYTSLYGKTSWWELCEYKCPFIFHHLLKIFKELASQMKKLGTS